MLDNKRGVFLITLLLILSTLGMMNLIINPGKATGNPVTNLIVEDQIITLSNFETGYLNISVPSNIYITEALMDVNLTSNFGCTLDIGNDGSVNSRFLRSTHENNFNHTPVWQNREEKGWETTWADIDLDGDMDLATSSRSSSTKYKIRIYRNSNSSLPESSYWESASPFIVTNILFEDINFDGYPDLLVSTSSSYLNGIIFVNNQGSFNSTPDWTASAYSGDDIKAGDLNGNNYMDVVLATRTGIKIYYDVLQNFSSEYNWNINYSRIDSIDLGDVDNDGDLDIAVGNNRITDYDWTDYIYANENGIFNETPIWTSAHVEDTESIEFADLNKDGYPDLVCGIRGPIGENYIYMNTGGVMGAEPYWTAPAGNTEDVDCVDVNNDGWLDVAFSQDTKIYLNNKGEISESSFGLVGHYDHSIDFGDIDGDGDPDLSVANKNEGYKVHINNMADSFNISIKNQLNYILRQYDPETGTINIPFKFLAYHNKGTVRIDRIEVNYVVSDDNKSDDDEDGFSDLDEIASGTNPLDPESVPFDYDGDSIPDALDSDDDDDSWPDDIETGQGSSPLDKNSQPSDIDGDRIPDGTDNDDDGDGWEDYIEDELKTDPLDASSVPDDTDGDGEPDGNRWNSEEWMDTDDDGDGFSDDMEDECYSDGRDPESVPEDTDNDGTPDCVDDDDDGDGWDDEDEKDCGSDPSDPSSVPEDFDGDNKPDCFDLDDDNDGMEDRWEIRYGMNPRDKSDARQDFDHDGFTNLEEFIGETNPTDKDDKPPEKSGGMGALVYVYIAIITSILIAVILILRALVLMRDK
jgi:hypothetical protein